MRVDALGDAVDPPEAQCLFNRLEIARVTLPLVGDEPDFAGLIVMLLEPVSPRGAVGGLNGGGDLHG